MTETRGRRLSMSFSPEQVIWLHEVLTNVRRCDDISFMLRAPVADSVQKTVLTAAQKAAPVSKTKPSDPVGPPPTEKRRPALAAFCHRGHPYVAENTYHYVRNGQNRRQCLTCKRAAKAKVVEKTREELKRRQDEAWKRLQEDREKKQQQHA